MYDTVMYIEINLICIFALMIMIIRMNVNIDKQTINIAFRRVTYLILSVLCIDIIWTLSANLPHLPFWHAVCSVISAVYFIMIGLICYAAYIYVECKIHGHIKHKKFTYLIITVPAFLFTLLSFSSIWSGLVFSIDENNVYHRGPIYFAIMIMAYFYVIALSVNIIIRLCKKEYKETRGSLGLLLMFIVFTGIGGVINMFVGGIPTVWPAATLSLLAIFIDYQGHQISTDSLTGLNNRRQFDKQLKTVTDDVHKEDRYALMMLDIDDFKHINDTFGHLAGDDALKTTSLILQKLCKQRDSFLARYGGDEFVIILHCVSEETAKSLKADIRNAFEINNHTSHAEYKLTLSVGYRMFSTSDGESPEVIISEADAALYREKQIRQKAIAI